MTALVGPLPTITFADETRQVYSPPRDTMDPRYRACTEHRTACDCREAMFAEDRSEWRAERRQTEQAFSEVLRGHQTWVFTDAGRDEMAECQCTGCQIVRLADCGWRPMWQVSKDRHAAGVPGRIGDEA